MPARRRQPSSHLPRLETNPSFTLPDDLNWDSFQRNFMAALGGCDVNGVAHPGTLHHGAPLSMTVGKAFTTQ